MRVLRVSLNEGFREVSLKQNAMIVLGGGRGEVVGVLLKISRTIGSITKHVFYFFKAFPKVVDVVI